MKLNVVAIVCRRSATMGTNPVGSTFPKKSDHKKIANSRGVGYSGEGDVLRQEIEIRHAPHQTVCGRVVGGTRRGYPSSILIFFPRGWYSWKSGGGEDDMNTNPSSRWKISISLACSLSCVFFGLQLIESRKQCLLASVTCFPIHEYGHSTKSGHSGVCWLYCFGTA